MVASVGAAARAVCYATPLQAAPSAVAAHRTVGAGNRCATGHRRDFARRVTHGLLQRTRAGAASSSLKTGLSRAWRLRAVLSLRAAGGVARGIGGRWNGPSSALEHPMRAAILSENRQEGANS